MVMECARRVALFLVVCVVAARAASAGDGLLPNGNFEYPPDRSQMSGSRLTGEYAIPNWRIPGSGFVEYIESGQKQGDMILTVPEGAHAVRLGHNATIQQQLTVTPGAQYSITFSAARTCAQHEKLSVSVIPGDTSDEVPIQTVYSSSGWDSYCWAFLAKESVVSFVILNPVSEDDPACGPVIDSVAIKTLYPPQAIQDNMLRNGDFEEGPYTPPDSRSGVLVPPRDEDDISPLSGWMIMSESKVVKYIDSAHFAVPRGSHAVELVAGGQAALVQEVDTVPGSSCTLEFSVGDSADGCITPSGSSMRVQASTAYGTKTVQYYSQGTGGNTRARLDFTPTGNRTRVALTSTAYHAKSDNSGTLCGPVVDDVSLVCVSQPASSPAASLVPCQVIVPVHHAVLENDCVLEIPVHHI